MKRRSTIERDVSGDDIDERGRRVNRDVPDEARRTGSGESNKGKKKRPSKEQQSDELRRKRQEEEEESSV